MHMEWHHHRHVLPQHNIAQQTTAYHMLTVCTPLTSSDTRTCVTLFRNEGRYAARG